MRLFEGQDNKIEILVACSIDVTGFSIDFVIGDYVEKIDSIVDGGLYEFTISSEDVEAIPSDRMFGCIVVVDSDGNPYQTMRFEVRKSVVIDGAGLVNVQSVGVTISSNSVGVVENNSGIGSNEILK